MQERSIVILVFALALALLCACSSGEKPAVPVDAVSAVDNTEASAPAPDQEPDPQPVPGSLPDIASPAQESEPASSPEPEPDRVRALDEVAFLPVDGRSPDRVLTSASYTVEVFTSTSEQDGSQIESREYCVSDGVTASTYRATGSGDCVFFDQEVTEPGVVWYYSYESGDWVCETLAEGSFSSIERRRSRSRCARLKKRLPW